MLRALARIDDGAIERNAARLAAAAAPAALCAVVKADGYGHGAEAAARAALAGGATWLAVATAGEAAALRAAGIEGCPLLIMGALSAEELTVALRARADVVAWRAGFAAAIAAHPDGAGARVHVKLDTGMGRLGTRDAEEATAVAGAVAAAPRPRARRRHDPLRDRGRRPGVRARAARRVPALGARAGRAPSGDRPARRELRGDAGDPRVAAGPRAVRDRALRHGSLRRLAGPARARARAARCAPTSRRSSGSRRGRARATVGASSPPRRPGSARCRSGTPTACAAR